MRGRLALTGRTHPDKARVLPELGAVAAPNCSSLGTDPGNGIVGAPHVKSVTSGVVPAAGTTPSYCKVSILYGTNPTENIQEGQQDLVWS